jgi:DNA-nicking Smr family endonuclease
MSGRDLSDEDAIAWQAATRHVKPLGGRSGRRATIIPSDSHPFSQVPIRRPKTPSTAKPENRQNEKAVRRGKQAVSASFDLHGHTQESAWRILPQFLAREQAQGSRCVIVITGKGRQGEGVLRKNFLRWLEMPEARRLVSGYATAHAKHGGGGAWYVYIRRA